MTHRTALGLVAAWVGMAALTVGMFAAVGFVCWLLFDSAFRMLGPA